METSNGLQYLEPNIPDGWLKYIILTKIVRIYTVSVKTCMDPPISTTRGGRSDLWITLSFTTQIWKRKYSNNYINLFKLEISLGSLWSVRNPILPELCLPNQSEELCHLSNTNSNDKAQVYSWKKEQKFSINFITVLHYTHRQITNCQMFDFSITRNY